MTPEDFLSPSERVRLKQFFEDRERAEAERVVSSVDHMTKCAACGGNVLYSTTCFNGVCTRCHDRGMCKGCKKAAAK